MSTILLADDDESIRKTLKSYLLKLGYSVDSVEDGQAALDYLSEKEYDLVISDIKMPGINGLELLNVIKENYPDTPVILITAHDDMQTTIKAMQAGAYDFVEKPIDINRFKLVIAKALETKKLSNTVKILSQENAAQIGINIIGKSAVMKDVFKKIGQVAGNDVNVLLVGESGTGKELAAKAIHYLGSRAAEPFIAVNCTALTESLLESEIFGHEKGAFTGAIREKKGKFELAGEGTIFLDEISEISPTLQIKLLRVLQEKEFERVGGETTIKIKARIISATNRDINKLVTDGIFREDLYYRLEVVRIDLPALRNRKDDIPLLVNYFISKINNQVHKKISQITDDALDYIINYPWYGNIRELENCLTQGIVMARGNTLEKENIVLKEIPEKEDSSNFYTLSIEDIERNHIEKILKYYKWNKNKAAEVLKISLPTLYSKIAAYKIKQD